MRTSAPTTAADPTGDDDTTTPDETAAPALRRLADEELPALSNVSG